MHRNRAGVRTSAVMALSALTLAISVASPTDPAPGELPLPEKARAVLHFDMGRLRTSDLYKEAEQRIGLFSKSNEKLQMFLEATGLATAASRVKSFTLYSIGGQKDFAGLVSGDFAPDTMRNLEQAYAPVARQAAGRIIMPVIQTPEMEVVMSFLAPNRLSFGTAPAVEAVVTSAHATASLHDALRRTETRRPIWGVIDAREMVAGLTEAARENGADSSPLKSIADNPALASVRAVGFSVDIGKDVFFELRALTDTAENARLLADAIKGMIALGQMGISQSSDPDLRSFFRDMIAESERDGVYVSFALNQAQVERLRQSGNLFSGVAP